MCHSDVLGPFTQCNLDYPCANCTTRRKQDLCHYEDLGNQDIILSQVDVIRRISSERDFLLLQKGAEHSMKRELLDTIHSLRALAHIPNGRDDTTNSIQKLALSSTCDNPKAQTEKDVGSDVPGMRTGCEFWTSRVQYEVRRLSFLSVTN